MIEFPKMAQLMHDEVVLHCSREINNFVIDTDILFARAAPPASFLITDRNPIHRKTIDRVIVCDPVFDQDQCLIFPGEVILSGELRCFRPIAVDKIQFLPNPVTFVEEKFFNNSPTEPPGRNHHDSPVAINPETQVFCPPTFAKRVGLHARHPYRQKEQSQRTPCVSYQMAWSYPLDRCTSFRNRPSLSCSPDSGEPWNER